jgi:hypothetical protein
VDFFQSASKTPIFAAVSQLALLMKKFTFCIFALLVLCSPLCSFAQSDEDPSGRYFSVGPVFSLGMTTFAGDVAEGFKIKPRVGFTFGALTELDISQSIAFNLGLWYESRGRYWYDEDNEELANYSAELGYLTLAPMFNFRHFLLGLGIRLPMSGTLITKGNAVTNRNDDLPFGPYEMKTAIDIKIGGNIELLETRGGTFNFIVLGGYDLTPPFKTINAPAFNPGEPDASLFLGLNYLFNAAPLK